MSVGVWSVREARRSDGHRREELLRRTVWSELWPSFYFVLLSETVMFSVLLLCALLLIFVQAGAVGLALAAAAAGLLLLAVVAAHLQDSLNRHLLDLRNEEFGIVAEITHGSYSELLQSVSVSRWNGAERRGLVRAWAGAGGGDDDVMRAVAEGARCRGLEALHALTSELQLPLRRALERAAFRPRVYYHRPLLGGALSLPLTAWELPLGAA